ncbi:M15 family metallopeptidase [Algibacter amylolyticus]|uniref:D-alanyl-D-alanine dipeptidase n=1 Tax=Algibacter amylolyticus TaxID=1608400 RepID=A0A5M7B8J2_9FLAO|nr:M15 family metallopeptidase [Algibacter amylolyticus]KAA5824557.1 M15 family metallopeptidase [Algibacter amylolyticus]TSJ75330.1 M15 family metallopeptidase [Algibacter amylolyticus]
MKYTLVFLFCLIFQNMFSQLPEGFVYVKDIIPDLGVELRYFTSNNFVGKPINSYQSNKLILTEQTAQALKKVQEALQEQNLCLKVYDGYRPQEAVNHFISWARDLNDTIMKPQFYPEVKKRNLFKSGYISSRSGHSRGSTVDLTIIDGNTGIPLDMGSPYDFFGEESWVAYPKLTDTQKANRQLLQTVMLKYNFRNYSKEWWHFTLRWEPFPKTYFDFPVE